MSSIVQVLLVVAVCGTVVFGIGEILVSGRKSRSSTRRSGPWTSERGASLNSEMDRDAELNGQPEGHGTNDLPS